MDVPCITGCSGRQLGVLSHKLFVSLIDLLLVCATRLQLRLASRATKLPEPGDKTPGEYVGTLRFVSIRDKTPVDISNRESRRRVGVRVTRGNSPNHESVPSRKPPIVWSLVVDAAVWNEARDKTPNRFPGSLFRARFDSTSSTGPFGRRASPLRTCPLILNVDKGKVPIGTRDRRCTCPNNGRHR